MKKIVLTFLTTVYLQCGAQNLVQNPSFEIYNNCPFELSQIEFSNNWSAGCEYGISTDYYNSCMNEDTTISDPFVLKISKEIDPRTGYSFSGILTYYYGSIINYSHNYREVLSNQLIKPLSHNINYCVTFYIKFAGYWLYEHNCYVNYATNNISALLLQDSILYLSPGFPEITYYSPQITYSGDFLNDSLNWVRVSGTFIAQGNEKWLHIANFFPDDSTQLYLLPSLSTFEDSILYQSYYLIDDVSVYPCDASVFFADAGKDTCVKYGRSITLGLPEREEYLYWWINSNTGDTISRQSQIVVNPQVTTTYILVQKDFKFDETRDSVTVKIGNCNGSPDYRGVDFEIFPNPNNGNFQVRFNTSIPDGAILQLHDMLGRVIGEYKLEGSGNTASLNIEVAQAIYCATVIIPNVFKKSVKIVVVN